MSKKQVLDPIVKFTTNYSLFKFLDGNRNVNKLNLNRVINSMKEYPLITIILVNERMEIIDGQHRFLALKELGLPINYVIVRGYGIKEVSVLNAIGMNWTKMDYLETHIKGGNENYIKFKKFREDFPKLTFSVCTRLLSGLNSLKMEILDGVKGKTKDFENGTFEIRDIDTAYENARKIMDFEPHYKGYSDLTFCLTLLSIFKHPNYDHARMLKRLSVQPNSIRGCKNQKQYHELLEEIFNYKSRNKLSLSTYLQK